MANSIALTKLADVLQVPLSKKGKNITGFAKLDVEVAPNVTLPLSVSVFLLTDANDCCSMLAHISGNLYVMVGFNMGTNVTSLYILDAAKLDGAAKLNPASLVKVSDTLRMAVNAFRQAIVHSAYHASAGWKPLKLPAE